MKYFGTDGIRGVPNKTLTNELVYNIGRALITLNCNDVYIATDTRISKDMLVCSLASGCMSMGINVHILGVLPTPALMYYSMIKKGIGVMITASHNPYFDNGIKIVKEGKKLNEKEELEIEKVLENHIENKNYVGMMFFEKNAQNEYINFILSKSIKTKYKICIDCANGATIDVAQKIFSYINSNTKFYAVVPDGTNINDGVGSTSIDYIRNKVLENNYDIGFAFDGDGDRVICVDSKGNVIDGDKLIYLIAMYLKRNNKLKNNIVALSIMSDLGLINSLKKHGIDVIECPVGDKYIYQAIVDNDLSLGGESSGHIIAYNDFHSGDGILIAVLVLKILESMNINIDEFFNDVDTYEKILVNLKVINKQKIIKSNKLKNKIETFKNKLNNDCKIILRASGTENLLRLLVMAKNIKDVDLISKDLVTLIKEIDCNE